MAVADVLEFIKYSVQIVDSKSSAVLARGSQVRKEGLGRRVSYILGRENGRFLQMNENFRFFCFFLFVPSAL